MGEHLITMLTCQEICRSIASDEVSAAGWRRRWAVKFHLLICRHCRRYSQQIESIGTAARGIFGATRSEADSRELLRNSILDRLPPKERNGSDPPV